MERSADNLREALFEAVDQLAKGEADLVAHGVSP